MMDRKPIKVGQLLAIMNQRMLRHRETATCRFISITPLNTSDRDACNWSSTVVWEANDGIRHFAQPFVDKIIKNAQREFNLLALGANSLS